MEVVCEISKLECGKQPLIILEPPLTGMFKDEPFHVWKEPHLFIYSFANLLILVLVENHA